MSSLQSRFFNLFDEGNFTTDVSEAIDIDREIPAISDTNTTRKQQTFTTEKKTNNNTVRINEMKHILKVTPQFLRANGRTTNKIFSHNTATKYSRKVYRHRDHNKKQEKVKYYLPEYTVISLNISLTQL